MNISNFDDLLRAGLALQHLDHVQAEAAVHQAWQHAHLDMAQQLARKLGRAVGLGKPA